MYGLVDGNNFFVSCERVMDPSLEGKAVAVLSNNDGCCVSRSNEFKALGIPMGTPYFQLKHREATGELIFRSSNYELYGDMSRRVISVLRDEALDVEQYSIDEAFIVPPSPEAAGKGGGEKAKGYGEWLCGYGKRLRSRILKWTGIPCGIGFAPTRTLAKMANHIGKKLPGGVFVMPDDPTDILAGLPVEEIWGIGRKMGSRLHASGIHTADQLRKMRDSDIRAIGSVVTLRTATELRGVSCLGERDYNADPESVSCSRSFGEPVTTETALSESIASFTAHAAAKLRRHGLLAGGCNVYAQMGTACEHSYVGRTVVFPDPTDATNYMLREISSVLPSLFVEGARYRKSGVVFFGLEKADAPRQGDLFASSAPVRSSKLYKAIDALNARYGNGRVFSASEGIVKGWRMRREKLSRRATTNWDELIVAR